MAKTKNIFVGWAMMRLTKTGNWKPVVVQLTKIDAIRQYRNTPWEAFGDYDKARRAGTLKVVKMFITM